ncbi:MAG TPA: AAA family ATPase [Pyrinomonadaceae bacterium]|nr:AAA family ATPase [Pyrinomonadaceae bacterium]
MSTTAEETEKTTKTELLLDSLEIKGYRCFEHLTIEKLGRVNLIVGKNNVGKTALLEALWLYANGGYEHLMFEILRERNEIPPFQNGNMLVQPESSNGLRNLFYARPPLNYDSSFMDSPEFIIADGNINKLAKESDILHPFINYIRITIVAPENPSAGRIPQTKRESSFLHNRRNYFIKSYGLNHKQLTEFWDNIERWVLEDSVIEALKIITPELKDIRFSGYPNGSFDRVPVVRLENAVERVPLKSLGEGMNKLLGIAAALVNCEYGILLIDEIEIGLHYSVLPDVWKLIFKTAKDLNVQVFATTHSKDCIEAFTQAAIDDEESDGMLIRLENKDGKIRAVNFNEDELETVERRNIEVR